ncbi:universal stress protein [Streptomyces sp. NPDC006997]|uniref:universal stress protein n=1 Tax=Streptomyces sp. NPDC006997 TaxID=3155356 RepID=UPI0033E14230
MLPPVVAGVDGSPESLAAAEWAAREAERRRCGLRLLHAHEGASRPHGTDPADAALRHLARRALRRAEERVDGACPGLRHDDEQVLGPATTALLTAAGRTQLLVLGSRGLSGFTGFLVGSVALGVIARATAPVVLVRADEQATDSHLPAADGSATTSTPYRDVVLGLDVTQPCDEVIEFAFDAARLRGARLRVVHAWQPPSVFGLGPGDIALVDNPYQAEEWQNFLSAVLLMWRDKFPEVPVLETVVREKPATALVRAASEASLLVVGHQLTERSIGPRTGPVTHAVVHHVGCPVAVVPHK